MAISSTSKTKVASLGIAPGIPCRPYPSSGLIFNLEDTFMTSLDWTGTQAYMTSDLHDLMTIKKDDESYMAL